MYRVYLGELLLPIAPAEIKKYSGSRNEIVSLINGGELNIIKGPSLAEISFDAIFPFQKYPFAVSDQGYVTPIEYINFLEAVKESKAPFNFKVIRLDNKNISVAKTENILVTLESFSYSESAEKGMDITASIKLKEYRPFKTSKFYSDEGNNTFLVQKNEKRDITPTEYIVKEGETLWDICKAFYGDGQMYISVAEKNNIKNPNRIYAGQVIYLE